MKESVNMNQYLQSVNGQKFDRFEIRCKKKKKSAGQAKSTHMPCLKQIPVNISLTRIDHFRNSAIRVNFLKNLSFSDGI